MYLTKRLPRETGRDYALRQLKENIIKLELEPGSMLSENELANEFGLSRTPVREALIELSKVKIVEIYPQRGSAIALVDYTMVEEARFMRKVMEQSVVELVCTMASEADIQQLQDIVKLHKFYFDNSDTDLMLETDNKFHRTLFEIAKKEQIYTLMQTILIHFDRVRRMSLMTQKDPSVISDHADIVGAIAKRDVKAAGNAMRTHLNRYDVDKKEIQKKYPQYFKD